MGAICKSLHSALLLQPVLVLRLPRPKETPERRQRHLRVARHVACFLRSKEPLMLCPNMSKSILSVKIYLRFCGVLVWNGWVWIKSSFLHFRRISAMLAGGGRRRKEEEGGGRRRKEEEGGGRRRKEEEGGGRRRKEEEGGGRRRKEEEGGGRRSPPRNDNGTPEIVLGSLEDLLKLFWPILKLL